MLLLSSTSEVLELLTTTVAEIDYNITYQDFPGSVTPYGSSQGKAITAGSTFISDEPSDGNRRMIKLITLRNTDPAVSNVITVRKQIQSNVYTLTADVTLLPGEVYEYTDSFGWIYYASDGTIKSTNTGIVAGGDLSGTYPNPSVVKILGNAVPVNALGFLHNDGSGVLAWQSAGTGTVTSVSGVAINGFTWSIANPTTTPAITLTLQNATTAQAGQLTSTDWNTFNNKQNALGYTPYNATNPSGYISGNQTITLSGDVSGSGTTSITTTIGAGKVTNAMLAGSISNSNLANSAITINGTSASLGGSITVGLSMQPVFSNVKRMQSYAVLSTTTGASGNVFYSAYFTGTPHTVKSIDIEVTVAVAASNVRLCLYADDGTGKPGALIESSGDISAATTGTKSYSFSSPIALTAQIYWLGFQASSGSIQIRYVSTGIIYIYNPTTSISNGYVQVQSYGAFPSNATPVSNATTIATTLTPQ